MDEARHVKGGRCLSAMRSSCRSRQTHLRTGRSEPGQRDRRAAPASAMAPSTRSLLLPHNQLSPWQPLSVGSVLNTNWLWLSVCCFPPSLHLYHEYTSRPRCCNTLSAVPRTEPVIPTLIQQQLLTSACVSQQF